MSVEATAEKAAAPPVVISRKKKALFTLIIFVIFLLALELVLRVAGLPPSLRTDPGLITVAEDRDSFDDALGFEYTPLWTGYDTGALVSINSAGWRGKEFSRTKPAGTVRILGVGDSYTFGKAVDNDDIFLVRLERLLNEGGGSRYETINTGHDGANTYEELRYFKKHDMMGLAPDVVVIGFTVGNDAELTFWDNRKILRSKLRDKSVMLDVTESDWFRGLKRNSRIAGILGAGADWANKDLITKHSFKLKLKTYDEGGEAWQSCRNSLIGFYEMCRDKKAPLVVILFPDWTRDARQTYADYPEEFKAIHEKLKALFAGQSGVAVVDIVDDLKATGLSVRELSVPIDGHPNAIWHELVATKLKDTIKGLGL
ncbi:MAG TPA: SGNH/GDSL hydrolase family protein [Blastocatellia bacterium]|nr:SGNH/GDSL hydrolase family protein [Blastocatellia bacterium]